MTSIVHMSSVFMHHVVFRILARWPQPVKHGGEAVSRHIILLITYLHNGIISSATLGLSVPSITLLSMFIE
jgi:hypothetical protein